MALDLGSYFGAASSLATSFGSEGSVKKFLSNISSLGVQIKCRFEVNFSGIQNVTFFCTDITTPSVKQNIGQVYYDGRVVEVPINYEYKHDFSMTILNDASGYIYSTVTSFLVNEAGSALTDSGYTMTVKAIGDDNCKGMILTLNGVRFKSCSGLQFSQSDGGVSTFTLECSAIDFNATPGALGAVGGVVNAVKGFVT